MLQTFITSFSPWIIIKVTFLYEYKVERHKLVAHIITLIPCRSAPKFCSLFHLSLFSGTLPINRPQLTRHSSCSRLVWNMSSHIHVYTSSLPQPHLTLSHSTFNIMFVLAAHILITITTRIQQISSHLLMKNSPKRRFLAKPVSIKETFHWFPHLFFMQGAIQSGGAAASPVPAWRL